MYIIVNSEITALFVQKNIFRQFLIKILLDFIKHFRKHLDKIVFLRFPILYLLRVIQSSICKNLCHVYAFNLVFEY